MQIGQRKTHIILAIIVLAGFLFVQKSAIANTVEWKTATKIYETDNWIDWPILISDNIGRLHLIWNEQELKDGQSTGRQMVFYMIKDGDVWSEPVDVLVPGFNYLDGFMDEYGRVNIALSSVNNYAAFSQTKDANSLASALWTEPLPLSNQSQFSASIDRTANGEIHLVYGGSGSIQHRTSSNMGQSWSDANSVQPALPTGLIVQGGTTRLESDANGNLYLSWTVAKLNEEFPILRTEFSFSDDNGRNWTQPVEIAPTDYQLAAMEVESNGRVHTLDIGRAGIGGRYHSWSDDNGRTWSPRVAISTPEEGTGLSGGDLALDSNDRLHAVFGLDATSGAAGESIVAHSVWNGKSWSPWVNISGNLGANLERMTLEVTGGNHLHAVWALFSENFSQNQNSLWYTETIVDAEPIPAMSLLAMPTPIPTTVPVTTSPTATPAPVDSLSDVDRVPLPQPFTQTSSFAILVGPISVLFMLGLALLWRLTKRRKV